MDRSWVTFTSILVAMIHCAVQILCYVIVFVSVASLSGLRGHDPYADLTRYATAIGLILAFPFGYFAIFVMFVFHGPLIPFGVLLTFPILMANSVLWGYAINSVGQGFLDDRIRLRRTNGENPQP